MKRSPAPEKKTILRHTLLMAVVLSLVLIAWMRKNQAPDPVLPIHTQEMATIMEMMASAGDSGDFEVSYPSKISTRDTTILRVAGKERAVLRDLDEGDCQGMAMAAANSPFDRAIFHKDGQKDAYELGDFDYREICQGGTHTLEFLTT